jgi:ATP-dependent exoDNAse (exonuclease V) beta subunit
VTIESAVAGGSRPGGARFGTLVHAVLADMPLAADADVVARLAEGHGRVLAATGDEVNAVKEVARAVSRHAVWRDAIRAEETGLCYRETPVTLRVDADTLIEGNVDLAFVSGDEIVVVDFKTDRELDGALDVYTRQVQTYAAAVAEAMGKKARGVLLRV